MNYNTGINWNLFFDQVDLIHDDKPIYIKNFIPNPEKLLSWNDVEDCLNGFEVIWELIEEQKKVNIPTYYSQWDGFIPDKKFIHNHINKGKTFVISRYSRSNPYIRALCKEIEKMFAVITDAHVYGAKGSSSCSFNPHYDSPANFIIQTFGECKWKVYSNTCSILMRESPKRFTVDPDKFTPIIETTLTPGDILYIPPQYYHVALPTRPRLSVSIPCFPGTEGRIDKDYYKI